MRDFVNVVSDSTSTTLERFHVLAAVVDNIAPPQTLNEPLQGISVLRGQLDAILPNLWQPAPPRAKDDAEKVGALTFHLGTPSVTMPLANTTFQNHRRSTLIASCFDLTQDGPRLSRREEKQWQHVRTPLHDQPQSLSDLRLWNPLVPLTQPRVINESFGNIIRRIQVGNESAPASTELEPAVEELFKRRSPETQGPMGIWATITPPSGSLDCAGHSSKPDPNPIATFDGTQSTQDLVKSTSDYIEQLYQQGGRLYRICTFPLPTLLDQLEG